ncbi:MAG TPA: hypothetical protein VMH81_03155 [Bryobacteraceae bacterium]|nr:hypothetical protein [Bryobacteraceae bacterium]
MTRILVVEDEPGIALGLEDDLKMEDTTSRWWVMARLHHAAPASHRSTSFCWMSC